MAKTSSPQAGALTLAAAVFAVSAWGLTAPVTKVAVTAMDPLGPAILRTVLAALLTVPLALAMGFRLPRQPAHWRLLALSSFGGFVAFPLLYTVGLRYGSAARGVLILAALPVFTGLYAALIERRLPVRRWWMGSLLALGGEALLLSSRGAAGEASTLGDGLMILAALAASLGYVAGGRLQQQGYSPWAATFWGAGLSAPVLAPLLFFVSWAPEPGGSALSAWLAIGYLALVSTVVAYVAWYWALGRGGIGRMGVVQFLQPVVGVVVSWLWLGDPLTGPMLAAMAAIMGGVVIAQRR